MCGIVGYVGPRKATPVLLDGLRRLEYRGYDSAGVALVDEGAIAVTKCVGRVGNLIEAVDDTAGGNLGIAHTRWATHGGVTQPNAHPHCDMTGRIAVVHNGIIDNDEGLKARLAADGVTFASETDTEVLPHLIARHYAGDPHEAVLKALQEVRGTYGLVVVFADHPDLIIAARNGSPLVVGLGEGENFIASDSHALVRYTRRVIYLEDREVACITATEVNSVQLDGSDAIHTVEELEAIYGSEDKGEFPHYMLKEIHEQPESIGRCLRGRILPDLGSARLGGFDMSPRDLTEIPRVTILGCGTSYHAAMVGAMAIEGLARVPAQAEIASEFRYRNPVIDPKALFMAVSQSGETADTLGGIKEVVTKGGRVMGVVNVVGSTIARTCGAGVYIHSGPEVAVASTKAFTSQVTALYTFTLMLARTRTLGPHDAVELARALVSVPDVVSEYLAEPGPIEEAVRHLVGARYALFMGRGLSFPVALEGALKLKEIAYIPCEAYPGGEMKHGPIAMMEPGTPVIAIVPDDQHREKMISNMQEVRARGAALTVIHSRGDLKAQSLASVSIPVPRIHTLLTPLISVLPLQLLSYQAALALGKDIDRPRNLAKSVTVE
ncbi:MAG: glutamine--fructose-6-phosphate transaminase (isomerizing) [Proteobacteria bacterium]|nr:glutamine--fructose-6-phosphate transaminase (isomerizing) [Pseudomonadota bacterium]MCP4919235.1 glutamine--fructose-6-phosphate transaminase (isomerizing) [Pseudomonadota bacterium]